MKKSLVAALSAFTFASVALSVLPLKAKADISMNFTSPFISSSGIANALGDMHYFTVAVTGLPIEGLRVDLPNEMQILKGATIVDQNGKEVAANINNTEGRLDLSFSEPIQPETYLTVKLDGVQMPESGFVMYRVSRMEEGLQGNIPIGTARVRFRDKT
jgi:hypothetical protein